MPSKPIGELVCPVCGEIFQCTYVDQWVYKKQWYNTRYVLCSWKCYRTLEKEMEARKSNRGRKRKEG